MNAVKFTKDPKATLRLHAAIRMGNYLELEDLLYSLGELDFIGGFNREMNVQVQQLRPGTKLKRMPLCPIMFFVEEMLRKRPPNLHQIWPNWMNEAVWRGAVDPDSEDSDQEH